MTVVTAVDINAWVTEKKKRKNLNWEVPPDILEEFDGAVRDRLDGRSKWIGATAAMLMYLRASDEERAKWEGIAAVTKFGDNAERTIAKLAAERTRGVRSSPPRGRPSKG